MSPQPLSRSEMELRRFCAASLFREGQPPAAVARAAGVSRTTAARWAADLRRGVSMKARKATGRPCRISAADLDTIRDLWRSQPAWKYRAFRDAVQQILGICYSEDHLGRLLVANGIKKPKGVS